MRQLLLALLQDGPGYIAHSVYLRPVNSWPRLSLVANRNAHSAPPQDVCAHTFGFIRLNRAGVGLLLGNADFHQSIQDGLTLDFQLSR